MRSRGLVVAIAVVLAVAAAAAVVLYVQGVKRDAETGGQLVPVIVATQEIPANQRLDALVDQGLFDEIAINQDAVVEGAVQNIDDLRGQTTVTPILANEQISLSRLSGSEEPLNLVGVSKGHIGVAFELEAPQGGSGNVQPGDRVAVFATYQNVQAIAGDLRSTLRNPSASATATRTVQVPDFTVTLIPTVRVLKIENPSVDSETGETSVNDRIRVTLDLLPEEAQRMVFAQENGLVWLGLLHPDEESGHGQPRADVVPIELLLGRRAG
jgi:Flp pilus assembly protein CpaB